MAKNYLIIKKIIECSIKEKRKKCIEFMVISCQQKHYWKERSKNVEAHEFKAETHFNHPGHLLILNNDLKIEIGTRIQKSKKYF